MTLVRARRRPARSAGSGQRHERLRDQRRFGAYVQLGEMPEKGNRESLRSSMIGGMTDRR
jgi:hypothetical protein